MKRVAILLFGASVYAMFLGVFLYALGFVGNFLVPTRLDGVAKLPIAQALLINLHLLALFAVQHSVMARPWFKKVVDTVRSRAHGTKHLRAMYEHRPGSTLLAVAADRRSCLGRAEFVGPSPFIRAPSAG